MERKISRSKVARSSVFFRVHEVISCSKMCLDRCAFFFGKRTNRRHSQTQSIRSSPTCSRPKVQPSSVETPRNFKSIFKKTPQAVYDTHPSTSIIKLPKSCSEIPSYKQLPQSHVDNTSHAFKKTPQLQTHARGPILDKLTHTKSALFAEEKHHRTVHHAPPKLRACTSATVTVNRPHEDAVSTGTSESYAPPKPEKKLLLRPSQIKVLAQWYTSQRGKPYPSPSEKRGLARQCGLSQNEVSMWFSNLRRSSRQHARIRTYNTRPVQHRRQPRDAF